MTGDAAAHYQAGIQANYERWGVAEADIEEYLAQEDVQLSSEAEEALRQVWTQEYINFYDQGYG